MKRLFLIFVVWQLALLVLAGVVAGSGVVRPGFEYIRVTLISHDAWLQNPLVLPWANFDGVHYVTIARDGYAHEARFFPMYPMIMRGVGTVAQQLPHADFWLVLLGDLMARAAFGGALLILYTLLRRDFSDKIAWWSCLALMLFPTSFFFVSVYAESLFLLLAVSCLAFARRQWWLCAALCAALTSATRIVGIVLLPVLLVEYFSTQRPRGNAWPLLLPPVGLLAFMYFNLRQWGNALYFLQQQADLGNSRSATQLVNPVQLLWRYLHILITVSPHIYEWWVALLEFVSFWFGIVALLWICHHRSFWRPKTSTLTTTIRTSYLVYTLGCFAIPVLSGTLTGLPRYILVIFPFFVLIGTALANRPKLRIVLLVTFAFLSAILTAAFTAGYFVA